MLNFEKIYNLVKLKFNYKATCLPKYNFPLAEGFNLFRSFLKFVNILKITYIR